MMKKKGVSGDDDFDALSGDDVEVTGDDADGEDEEFLDDEDLDEDEDLGDDGDDFDEDFEDDGAFEDDFSDLADTDEE